MGEVATVIPIGIHKLKRLKMQLPPARLFDEPLGCSGNRRFFALYWSRADRVPVLNDGLFEIVGAPDPYRVWRYHPKVIAALEEYNIGDTAISADHWLLVDRKSRALYVGKVWDVLAILDLQKNGTLEPYHETGPSSNSRDLKNLEGGGTAAPGKKYKKPLFSGMKLLNELEAWINANI
ncbi:MAG TPA: hypothetical protein VFG19_14315 [Geobacteraceae bacterium]|nr:hypothetical protein [Geobacteraceae bacterium]